MNPRSLVVLLLGLLSLLAAACGPEGPATAMPETVGSGAPAATSAPAQPPESGGPAPSSGMDVSTIDLCTVLPRAELAGLAGGTPYEADAPPGQLCIYTIDPGDGTAALYSLGIFASDLIQATLDYIRDYEQAEWIEGLGDAAALQPSLVDEGYDLNVLVEGAYGLTISGPDPEVLQAAARLVLERVGE